MWSPDWSPQVTLLLSAFSSSVSDPLEDFPQLSLLAPKRATALLLLSRSEFTGRERDASEAGGDLSQGLNGDILEK